MRAPIPEPKPGDLIEIFRPFYRHWAIYVGDGYVVHLAPPNGSHIRLIAASWAATLFLCGVFLLLLLLGGLFLALSI